eukprot:3574190-Pyramimonas_sp.AAC.1
MATAPACEGLYAAGRQSPHQKLGATAEQMRKRPELQHVHRRALHGHRHWRQTRVEEAHHPRGPCRRHRRRCRLLHLRTHQQQHEGHVRTPSRMLVTMAHDNVLRLDGKH